MSQKATSSFLEEALGLLVKHFGADRVMAALPQGPENLRKIAEPKAQGLSKPNRKANPTITVTLEKLRLTNEEKYNLLNTFYLNLKGSTVLPESQDIRQFAQNIGLKEIKGKSRKEMIPKLMRFLSEQSSEQIRTDISQAANVSEQQRKQGYSILTDKLLGES
jgi:hypothetical protein